MTIKEKIHLEFFDAIASNKKKYEFRVADFDLKSGDILVLEEWDPKIGKYTVRSIIKKVSYVKKFKLDEFGQRDLIEKHGFYIASLE